MEDYDTFVRNRLTQLRNKDEEHKKPASSAIRFYGAPILPPVLTDTRREEMQRHKVEAAQKDALSRRLKDNQRFAYVQSILHSVQIRHSPTLDDLLEELKFTPKSLESSKSSESSQPSINTVAEMNSPRIRSLSSTINSASFTSHVIPQPSHKVGCLVEHRGNQQSSEPSFNTANHCAASLGRETSAIVENTTSHSQSLDVRSVGPQETNNTTDYLLHKTSKAISNIPDIISYPPIDGEELERSGLESSFCHAFIGMNDSCCAAFQENSIGSDNFPGGTSENIKMKSAESQDDLPSSTGLNMKEGQTIKQVMEVPVPSLHNCSASNIPELPQTQSIDCSSADQLNQSNPENTEWVYTLEPQAQSQTPNRPSLQDLLRKSQEYREQQRLLRNQAKNARIQEKTQEQPQVEEKSLSDKENNEFYYKATEGRKTKEKRFVKTVNTTCKKSNEKNLNFPGEVISKKTNRDLERVSEHITLSHPQLLSQSQTQNVYHMNNDQTTTDPFTYLEDLGTHHSIPVPNFCLSPVYTKSSSNIPDEGDNFMGKVLISSSYHESHKSNEAPNLGPQGDVPNITVQSSQHINQLESGLSSLKDLISDLGLSLKEIEGKWEDRPDGSSGASNRQSLEPCRNLFENTDEQNSSKDNSRSILQDEDNEVVNLAEISLVNTLTLQGKINEEAFNVSSRQLEGSRKQQPPAKCVLSVAKWMPIPHVSDPASSHDVSIQLDSNSHHTERKQDSHIVLAVSQSLDGDMPSEMRLLDDSDSEEDSSDHLVQAKELTPESVAGIEGTSSKVKRRLLMHVTDNLDMTETPSIEDLTEVKSSYSASRVASPASERFAEELKEVHVAQVRALQEEHRRQQEELCQALAARYSLLQSSSFPCSLSGSHLGDTVTFSKLSQPPSSGLDRCRPLLLAAVKGYLTRRLLRTERVAQLARTIGDTKQFLQAFQLSQHRGDICSKQDRLLQQRVALQLRAARYEIYDIFFSLSVAERMQLISLDRELTRERVLRRQMEQISCPKGRSALSAATQKSLQRKRGILIQRKVSERHRGVVTTEHKTGFASEQPLETKRVRLRTKPARISQRFYSCRPR
ncbi:uncharacterized protein cp110 [Vanacampus margaritifer]